MKRFLTLGIRVALCLAAGVAGTAKDKIVIVPPALRSGGRVPEALPCGEVGRLRM